MEDKKNSTFLLSARCEDGKNLCLETEWDATLADHIIGAYVTLGVKMANEITDEKGRRAVYKLLEETFHKLQSEETEESIRKMAEEG